ncbi:endopeptidase La [Helicobacter sp. MIT 99-5507]|uniref:endopeptidase La n=1 Tax=Helicobacter sp. MIT 99-5507 TaxID=152489 RepID=UPI000E1EFB6D|nr:endopeptidase La [Helicobacter sp. MIT 99-5507]
MNLNNITFPINLPILIDESTFIYPSTITPIFINDEASINALSKAQEENNVIFITTSKDIDIESDEQNDFYDVGVVGNIMRKVSLPNGKIKFLFQGVSRAKILSIDSEGPLMGTINLIIPDPHDPIKLNATLALLNERIDVMSKLLPYFPNDLLKTIESYEPNRMVDTILSTLRISKNKIYNIYASSNTIDRLILLISYIDEEIEALKLQKEIKTKVNNKVEKINRDFYLKEQLKQIQKELGIDNQKNEEIEAYYKKLESIKPHIDVDGYKEIKKQIDRLSRMHQDSSESSMIQNYIEWMLEIPFGKFSTKKMSINAVSKQLDSDHYSLAKPKQRICEYFAVKELLALRGKESIQNRGTILCFYGPPGVGKTSLANSIAKALKRSLIRIALGGLEDVNELRGHRRTYLGAMPGRIVQGLIDAKEMNPVVVLDEIDKVGKSYRGDPTSVLLEILDPEQNVAFRDYYANFNINLSQIIFIATANDISQIPAPLRDRMEFIELYSYTPQEKLEIAKKYLIPQELKKHGIANTEFSINTNALKEIIEKYTREAGVRKLREKIAQIMRKSAREILEDSNKKVSITTHNLKNYLDKIVFEIESTKGVDKIGVVNGLAWTSVGGDVLKIEAIKIVGKGALELTGNLGDVMKESAKIALSVNKFLIDKKSKAKEQIYNKYNIHIHVPEGATPKDGPSAGISMAVSIASVFLDKKVNSKIAMTGELTLTGDILPIGGLKEKLIAAYKAGMKSVLIPEKNYKRDLDEIPNEVLKQLKIFPVSRIEEVLDKALVK